MLPEKIQEGLTFDDVLLKPARSAVLPAEADTRTWATRNIALNIPIVSAAMDTVTESHLAIALAQQGGIGIIHRNMTVERQAEEVDKVKRSESGMIVDPITIGPDQPITDALDLMKRYRISGVPVTHNGGKLVGILTNRDLRFENNFNQPVSAVMTKDNLITVAVGTTLEEAELILHKHRVEKLLVVDDTFHLKGLITVKDIQKKLKYPSACKDSQGRLRVGAALGTVGDYLERAEELVRRKVDVLAIDSAHGHSERVLEAVVAVKKKFPHVDLIAGNVATFEGARDLIELGVDGIKVGIGPGSICTTRIVSGAGVPQITAIAECARGARVGRAGDRRRRHQVLLGRDQGDRGGRGFGDDRIAVRGHGRVAGRDDFVSGPHVQELSRHGIDRSDVRRILGGPLCAGRLGQAGAGGNRRPGSVQGHAGGSRVPTGGRVARGHGVCRVRVHQGAARQGAVPARERGGLAGVARA
jgi:inosine-5'-monophosphate dehydrogenase